MILTYQLVIQLTSFRLAVLAVIAIVTGCIAVIKTFKYIQGGPKVGIQLLKYFLYALKLHAMYFMLLVK